MRETIILPDSYECILLFEGLDKGIIKEIDFGESSDEFEKDLSKKFYQVPYKKINSQRQNFYQMLLLYDKIIIPNTEPTIDFTPLREYGIEFIQHDEYMGYNPLKTDGGKDAAEYLQEAILPNLYATMQDRFLKVAPKDEVNKMIKALYRGVTGIEQFAPEKDKKLMAYLEAMYRNVREKWYGSLNGSYDLTFDMYMAQIIQEVIATYDDLCLKLDISAMNNAYLINSGYDLSKLGIDDDSAKIKKEAYGTLKIAYGKVIDTLPGFNNISEVFEVKKKKKRELKGLREEIATLEEILSSKDNDSKEKALTKAIEDVGKAKAALNKGIPVTDQIGKMTTLIGIPIGAVEYFSSCMGSVPLGLSISVVGGIMLGVNGYTKRNNGWSEIIK